MKYRKNGRVYKTAPYAPCCKCDALQDCHQWGNGSFRACYNGYIWRETLFSKIRNWRRKG